MRGGCPIRGTVTDWSAWEIRTSRLVFDHPRLVGAGRSVSCSCASSLRRDAHTVVSLVVVTSHGWSINEILPRCIRYTSSPGVVCGRLPGRATRRGLFRTQEAMYACKGPLSTSITGLQQSGYTARPVLHHPHWFGRCRVSTPDVSLVYRVGRCACYPLGGVAPRPCCRYRSSAQPLFSWLCKVGSDHDQPVIMADPVNIRRPDHVTERQHYI